MLISSSLFSEKCSKSRTLQEHIHYEFITHKTENKIAKENKIVCEIGLVAK